MKIQKLANNQLYFIDGEKIVFQSYKTIVCQITNFQNGKNIIVKITEGQPQSRTTAKYLNQFLNITIGENDYKKFVK